LEITTEKNHRTDSITLEIDYVILNSAKTALFSLREHKPQTVQMVDKLIILTQIKEIGVSFIDDKPKEILFLRVDHLQLENLLNIDSLDLIDILLIVNDVQLDFQLKQSNKVCLLTRRDIKKSKYSTFSFWGESQVKPFLKLMVNIFSHANTEIINVRGKASKLICNLEGHAISRLLALISLVSNIFVQASHVFFTAPAPPVDPHRNLVPKFRRFNLHFKPLEIDLYLSSLPELISAFSNDYTFKIISMIFSDCCFFPLRFREFSSDSVSSSYQEPCFERTKHQGNHHQPLHVSVWNLSDRLHFQHQTLRKSCQNICQPSRSAHKRLQR
jgi:hypothetical protein